MATTHSLYKPDLGTQSLPSFRIYVHPPEEEFMPSVCAFDAADPHRQLDPANESDEEEEDIDSGCEADAYFGRDDCMSGRRRTVDGRSIEDVLAAADEYEYSSDDGEDEDADTTIRGPSSADDSEVIEVVKVKRRRGEEKEEQQPAPSLPRSNTFMAKASRVFSAFRSKSKPQPEYSAPAPPPPPPPPPASVKGKGLRNDRRSSLSLGQIFTRAPVENPSLRKQSTSSFASSRGSSDILANLQEPEPDRAPSPAPSTRSNFRRKVSVLIPTFSPSNSAPEPLNRRNISEQSSRSSSSGSSESAASDCLTPVDTTSQGPPATTPINKVRRSFSFARKSSEPETEVVKIVQPAPAPVLDEPGLADTSMEMRLDSFHFDDMSFDLTKF